MKLSPIIFQDDNVVKIHKGLKTATRRVISPQPEPDGKWWVWRCPKLTSVGYGAPYVHTDYDAMTKAMRSVCRYGTKDDVLWVKEAAKFVDNGLFSDEVIYRADKKRRTVKGDNWQKKNGQWTSPLFMPRWAARLFLKITYVGVERLHQMTTKDAEKEGVASIDEYMELWDLINRNTPWGSNPFVYVVEFEQCLEPKSYV